MPRPDYYIDPHSSVDGGDGTIGNPWTRSYGGVLQYALNNIIKGANGDNIHIKSGSPDVLVGNIDWSLYGVPTASRPLLLRGYSAFKGDGGIGAIDGNGLYTISPTILSYSIYLCDIKYGNYVISSPNNFLSLSEGGSIVRCEFHDVYGGSSSSRPVVIRLGAVIGCWFHNFDSEVARHSIFKSTDNGGSFVGWNYVNIPSGTTWKLYGMELSGSDCSWKNIVAVRDSDVFGIVFGASSADNAFLIGNSIFCESPVSGSVGVFAIRAAERDILISNIIEGFSGSGNWAVYAPGQRAGIVASNTFFNNLVNLYAGWVPEYNVGDIDRPSSSFIDPSNGDFRVNRNATDRNITLNYLGAPDSFDIPTGQEASTNHEDGGACQRFNPDGVPITLTSSSIS